MITRKGVVGFVLFVCLRVFLFAYVFVYVFVCLFVCLNKLCYNHLCIGSIISVSSSSCANGAGLSPSGWVCQCAGATLTGRRDGAASTSSVLVLSSLRLSDSARGSTGFSVLSALGAISEDISEIGCKYFWCSKSTLLEHLSNHSDCS